ncbi:MAG: ATP-dependent helicase [Parachlamydiales bacterium]
MLTLNPAQLQAAEHIEGPLLVLAGAGAGKTRIVTARVARLIELGVSPSAILAVTFTNKAAGEMKERILRACHKNVLVSTFHSLGARILRESIGELGFSSDFVIYDEEDSQKLLKACLEQVGAPKEVKPKAIRGLISDAKNSQTPPEALSTSGLTTKAERLFPEVYALYQAKLKEYNALDFDDLLFLTVRLFQEHPETLRRYQERWQFTLIDEYQDTNQAQYLMSRYLAGERQNLFVVGDPDQSIYSWRGANISNILDFEKDYPGAKVVRLEQNYRSTNTILEAANALIQHNRGRYEKNLWSELGAGEPIRIARVGSEREEADLIVREIDRFHTREEISLDEIVVFYRTNAQSRPFEDALLARRIPYVIVGGLSFYQRREIKDILALLRVLATGSDYLSFARTVNIPKRGLGNTTLQKIEAYASEHQRPLLAACEETPGLSKKQKEGLADYLALIRALREVQERAPLYELVYQAIKQSGYVSYLKEDMETYQDRKENLDELVSKASEWGEQNPEGTLGAFLEELSLKSTLDETAGPDERISLMTLHNGKGLEFTATFIAGMEEGLFPHINSAGSPEALEEERRLCYVGMTRAKRHLTLTHATFRFIWGSSQTMRPSRFLREIPKKYTQEMAGPVDTFLHRSATFSTGDRLEHPDFGCGVIQEIGTNSLGVVYRVQFERDGSERTLVAKYASLYPA